MQDRIPWKVRREQRGGGDGETGWSAAGEGVEPGRDPEVERVKGEIVIWKSARDIILVPTSDVVIRPGPTALRHRIYLSPTRRFPSSSPHPSCRLLLTHIPCPEVNPRNTVRPLTSSPLSIKNNSPLTRPLMPPKTRSPAHRQDQIWI